MKILYGITKSNFGGAQRYVFDLAVEAKKRGHDVFVLCGGQGALVKKLEQEEVPIIFLNQVERDINTKNDTSSFFEIYKILKREKPEIFHINSSKMGGLGAVAGRLAGIKKIIFTSHGWAFNEPRPLWQKVIIKFLVWLTILFSHKTICVSEKTKDDVSGLPFVSRKLAVIYNGIKNFELLSQNEARNKLGIQNNETLVFGTLAELHVIKGLDILLKSWKKFSNSRIESKLVIIGDGEEKENLKKLAEKLDIVDSVIFKGYLENARSLLKAFDIFILPSRSENLPYSILEAGIAQLPVIATRVGGIPEIIETTINGALIPKEDSESLFSTMILFANDMPLRNRLAKNLYATIQKNFSFDQMANKTFNLYSKV